MFYYLLIVNKNGSLIYDRAFSNSLKLTSNEVINIASIFYSMHAISSKLTPPGYEQTSELKLENGGIEIMEASAMRLVCFPQSPIPNPHYEMAINIEILYIIK